MNKANECVCPILNVKSAEEENTVENTNSVSPSLAQKHKVTAVLACCSLLLVILVLKDAGPRTVVSAQELQSPVSCDANPVPNPLQVAALRWYSRNTAARIPLPGPVQAMTSDGSNMYLALPGEIVKIRASDGALLATFTDFGGLEISNLAGPMVFDGTHLWIDLVASDASWAELRASDGAFVTSGGGVPSNAGGRGIAFDGQSIWMSDSGGLVRINETGARNTSFFSGGAPVGLAFDGHNIWIADEAGSVIVRRNSDGAVVRTISLGGFPWAVAFDGADMWVTNRDHNNVTKIRVHDGAVLGTFPTQSTPSSIVFDGANIWIGNTGSNSITKLRACDGTNLGTFAAGGSPSSLAFDGINVWVPMANNTVGKM
jgi:hypothetical protein